MTQCISDYDDLVQGMAKDASQSPKREGERKRSLSYAKKASTSPRKHGE